MGKCYVKSVAGAFLLLLAIAPRVSGQAELTVSGGILLPGEAYVEEWDVYPEIDMSPMVSLSYDSYQVPSLGFGVFLNAASLSVEGESGTMITLGGGRQTTMDGGRGQGPHAGCQSGNRLSIRVE